MGVALLVKCFDDTAIQAARHFSEGWPSGPPAGNRCDALNIMRCVCEALYRFVEQHQCAVRFAHVHTGVRTKQESLQLVIRSHDAEPTF